MMAALARQALRVLVAALLVVAPLSAGINRWTPVGPPGGDPANLAVAPSAPGVVYLGCVYSDCNEGIFRSDDGGAHWHLQGPFGYLSGLIVDPHDADTLYAPLTLDENGDNSFSLGVVKSTDGGATWQRADLGLESSEDSFVTPNLVFAGAGRLLVPTDHGIYETVDGGASWHLQSLAGVSVLLLASDPSDSAHWLASTGDVLETHDAGKSWSSTNFTLGVPVQMLSVGNCLYAITYVSYETTVSFFRRLDGRAWEPILFLPNGVWPMALAASPEGILYLATTLGAYRSLDQGTTWSPGGRSGGRQTARPDDYLVDVTVVPGSPDAVLTSGYSEIWRSGDAGTTWQPSSAGLYGNEFDALTVAADSTVYAAVTTQGIFRSRDRGATWRKRTVGLGLGPPQPPTTADFTISALAADPHDSAHLYAAIWAAAGATTSIAQTTDAGDHWQSSSLPAGTAAIRSLQVDPASSEGLYAIADVDTIVPAVLHSFDGGKSWSRLLTDANAILSLAIDPQRPTTLYAGTFDRFLKSVDGGRSWTQAGRGLPQAAGNVLAVDPQHSRRLYAGPGGGGVYVSNDEGESFHPMNHGLPAGTGAYQLVVDPRGSFLYLLDPEHGIFRWLPEAQSWTMVEDGLPPRFRESRSYLFAIDPARPDVLYAGGQNGLFQLTIR